MPPRQKTPESAAAAYKVGDVITDIKPGVLVRRPDGVVVTVGGSHALNLAGEYAFIDAKGHETTVTVSEPDPATDQS